MFRRMFILHDLGTSGEIYFQPLEGIDTQGTPAHFG